jgi:hypothetical protein
MVASFPNITTPIIKCVFALEIYVYQILMGSGNARTTLRITVMSGQSRIVRSYSQ